MAKTTKTATQKRRTKSSSFKKVSPVKSVKAFRTYKQGIDYLFKMTNYEKEEYVRYNGTTFNLDRMKKLLSLVGNPHKKLQTVHIAGTKGKGSTATMLACMLEANHYKVGLYTSPHVVDLHERITINSNKISVSEMLGLLNRVHGPVDSMSDKDGPTFFEIMTAMAFMFFADNEVDLAVIETGLGGRLDSTNVISPKIIGITSISIDHTLQLGHSIDKIAEEKAGIFKKGVPVVTVEQDPVAMKILKSRALANEASFHVTGKDIDFSYRFETSREHGPHTRICLTTPSCRFEHLRVPLYGRHMAINCGLALALLDRLHADGFKIDIEKATKGLADVNLPGRMEMICRDPRVMIDGAHNADSIRALIHAIGQNIPYDSMVVIFGCNTDKDVKGMLEQLQYGADKVIFTRSNSNKAASPHDLAEMFTEISHKMCQVSSSLGEALQLANSAVSREDLILITGSFYLIGQAKLRFEEQLPVVEAQ